MTLASTTFANPQLSNSNYPKTLPKANLLSLVPTVKDKLSNLESMAGSKAGIKDKLNKKTDIFSKIFAIETDQSQR